MQLPKSLTTVTPFSKFLAMALFILLPLVGFYAGSEYQKIFSLNENGLIISRKSLRPEIKIEGSLESVIQNSTIKILSYNKDNRKEAPQEITDKYLPLWEKLFKEKNQITEAYYRNHYKAVNTYVTTEQDPAFVEHKPLRKGRDFFTIVTSYKYDWVSFYLFNYLTIRERNEENYLSTEQIENNKDYQNIRSAIEIEKIPYSFNQVVQVIKSIDPEARNIYLDRFDTLPYEFNANETIKTPVSIYLIANGTIDFKKNLCEVIMIDIITLETKKSPSMCFIE